LRKRSAGAVFSFLEGEIGHPAAMDCHDIAKSDAENSSIEVHRSLKIANRYLNMSDQVHRALIQID
jgi:hypothetical protein